MSEASAGVASEINPVQIRNELINPRIITKKTDQEGRTSLLDSAKKAKNEEERIKTEVHLTETALQNRQENVFVKLKQKLKIPDEKTVEMQVQLLELHTAQDQLPNRKEMLDAYYEKASETPLTNQEKRDLLKPEVLSQLSTEEYIDLWKKLNPHFLAHVTRQGFRDHNAMFYHSAGMQEFHNGFLNIINDEKQLRPPLALEGLKNRDEATVQMFLSKWVLQAENEEEAKTRFNDLLHWSLASAPKYQDSTAIHFAAQMVANGYYGGERNNEVFFIFPSDVLASQHSFTFNGWEKDFTHPQSEDKWNDVFVWPNTLEDPGVSIDAGITFLPEREQVDPNTGSKYASEIKIVDGKEKRVMVENTELKDKFMNWSKTLTENSLIVKKAQEYYVNRNEMTKYEFHGLCEQELMNLGFDQDSMVTFLPSFRQRLLDWNENVTEEHYRQLFDESSARWKKAESTIPAKDYWENFFSKNPTLKPKHIVYYSDFPTNAVYKFQQENGIGRADTSKTEGQLLGFDDHHVTDIENDPRADRGHQELIDMGNTINKEHYAFI